MSEQIMENLTDEEHEELMLLSEHAVAPPFSASAKAVWRAFESASICAEVKLAAALCSVANELIPVPIAAGSESEHWKLLGVRNKLLAIADELDGQ